MAQVYLDTQTGAFVNDTEDALDYLQKTRRTESFILGGLCGGAITGLLLAEKDPRVSGLLSLGIPTTLETGASDHQKVVTQGELTVLRKGYFRRMLQPKSWLRLLTFQSDFHTIFRSISQVLRKSTHPKSTAQSDNEPSNPAPDVNPYFAPAFFKMADTDRKHLLIFSGRDRLFWEFEEKFADFHSERLREASNSYQLHVVKEANHIFSFREWEQEMLDITSRWLEANFSGRNAVKVGSR